MASSKLTINAIRSVVLKMWYEAKLHDKSGKVIGQQELEAETDDQAYAMANDGTTLGLWVEVTNITRLKNRMLFK